jgi:hypothetical protein
VEAGRGRGSALSIREHSDSPISSSPISRVLGEGEERGRGRGGEERGRREGEKRGGEERGGREGEKRGGEERGRREGGRERWGERE